MSAKAAIFAPATAQMIPATMSNVIEAPRTMRPRAVMAHHYPLRSADMALDDHVRRTNAFMIAFDAVLGSAALLAPAGTLRVLGHDAPSPDAERLFQRCGPIWLTFAAAHAV